MKLWMWGVAGVAVALIWFRSGRRFGGSARGNLLALLIFVLMLAGMVGLLLMALKI